MRLRVNNIGAVTEATITVDGITVITGENNTGKSTIGKTLFASFYAMRDIRNRIHSMRMNKISGQIRRIIEKYNVKGNSSVYSTRAMQAYSRITARLLESIKKPEQDYDFDAIRAKLADAIDTYITLSEPEAAESIKEDMISIVEDALKIPGEEIVRELVERSFNMVFADQVANIFREGDKPIEARLEIQNSQVVVQFSNENACINVEDEVLIEHRVFYIDDPFIIDRLAELREGRMYMGGLGSLMQQDLIEKIHLRRPTDSEEVLDAIAAKKKMGDVYKLIESAVDGSIEYKDGVYAYAMSDKNRIHIGNVSTGMKSFLIIKTLIENGVIKEKDIIILDEPEVHLHTEWQSLYAEIIVLLQKEFNLTVLLTTHSSHFMHAIEVYAKKHGLENRCNYYKAVNNEGHVSFDDVTSSMESSYYQLVKPSLDLDRLEYQLMGDKDD